MTSDLSNPATGGAIGMRDVATAFFRHKKKALLFACFVLSLGVLVILFAPRTYRSEARLFLQVGRESIRLDPTATTGQTIALQQSGRGVEVATCMEVLKSRAIIEKTVDRLTPEVVLGRAGDGQAEPNPVADSVLAPLRFVFAAARSVDPISAREEAIIKVSHNFGVDAEHESAVIVMTYDSETAKLARLVLNALVETYREEHVRLHQTSGSRPFFEEQRRALEQQLVDSENKLRDAKNRMGVTSVASRRSTLETRLGSIEVSRNSTIQSIASVNARVASLQAHTDAMPERMHTSTSVMPNTGADALRAQLFALQTQLDHLEGMYHAEHPLVAAKRLQVEKARETIEAEEDVRQVTVDSVNDNQRALLLDLAKAKSDLAGYEAQLAELNEQRSAALADLRRLNDFELEVAELERAATLSRTNFFGYAEDLEHARIDEELDRQRITNVAVAQEATLAEKPIRPSKFLVAALSAALAGAGATLIVLLGEKFDSRLYSEDQIENVLRMPVLASVPEGRAYATAPTLKAKI